MSYLYKIFVFICVICTASCTAQNNANVLTVQQFAEKLKTNPDVQLIDVRTPDECANGMIARAKNINWNSSDFEAQILALDKQKPVFVYCAKGGRSHAAQEKLTALGFKEVYDLKGGFSAWKKEAE